MSVHVFIPARLGSTRFPGKVLVELWGEPLLRHVWNASVEAVGDDRVTVVTDSPDVARSVEAWGGSFVMSSPDATCGTERIAEVAASFDVVSFVNVQADDPKIRPSLIREATEAHRASGGAVTTPVYPLASTDASSPHIVKVARSVSGRALYFSRSVIPFDRDEALDRAAAYWGHVGLYVYSGEALRAFGELSEGHLESREKLEQLRFLENGIEVDTFVTDYQPSAIDTQEDLARVQ